MDISKLTHGAKLVLGGAIVLLIVSFFNWFEVGGEIGEAAEAFGVDAGWSMWHGISGVLGGLLLIALLVWEALRLVNINVTLPVQPAMTSAFIAILMAVFVVIRFIDAPGGLDRTFFAWIGVVLAIAIAVGAVLNMQAAGQSFADVKQTLASGAAAATSAAKSATSSEDEPAAPAPAAPAAPEPAPATGEAADEKQQ